MAPTKSSKAAVATDKVKKEKVFHPHSRKAGQLARKALRKGKMGSQATVRHKKHNHLADVYTFFYECLPESGELTMDELHGLLRDVWLSRYDDELGEEKAARRKGRPKSLKETRLEEIKLRETENYRTGFEVIDLTHSATVELFRRWDQKEVAFMQLLRFIRISSANPDLAVVSKPGKHHSIIGDPTETGMQIDS